MRALACRSVREQFVNGRAEPVGYLSHLRVATEQQGRWIVSRGMAELRRLHADGRVRGYVSTIIAGASVAAGVLGSEERFRELLRSVVESADRGGAEVSVSPEPATAPAPPSVTVS